MAEYSDDGFLLYLLDMAILEANRKARSGGEKRVAADMGGFPQNGDSEPGNTLAAELKVVR